MKPILLLVLALAFGAMARAEIFVPRIVGGRGGQIDRSARVMGDHRQAFTGNRRGLHFDGFRHGRDRDDLWDFGLGWWGPAAVLSFGYDDYLYDGWYGWPRSYRYAGWYGRPANFEPEICPVYAPAYGNVAYVANRQASAMPVRDDIRDARSPEQLRAIYGAQAEQLIRQGY
ncbi:MAG TPA: hypothetical protein VMC06_00185 [Opitutaceae bacterium]|nr:hypothetical protein [Opitutaceae bacterium]